MRFRFARRLALRRSVAAADLFRLFLLALYHLRCPHAIINWSDMHAQVAKSTKTAVRAPSGGLLGGRGKMISMAL